MFGLALGESGKEDLRSGRASGCSRRAATRGLEGRTIQAAAISGLVACALQSNTLSRDLCTAHAPKNPGRVDCPGRGIRLKSPDGRPVRNPEGRAAQRGDLL